MNNQLLNNIKAYLPLFILILIVGFYDLIFSFGTFFITEGWWETYAYLNRSGFDLYENAYLKLPPLYPQLIGFLQQLIGDELLKLRLIFIPIHLIILTLFFFLLKKRTTDFFALIGVSIALGFVISNPVYLVKDYHTLLELLVVIVLLFLPLYREFDSRNYYRNIFVVGFVSGLILLSKQNIGILLTFSLALSLLLDLRREKANIKKYLIVSAIFSFSFFTPLFLYSIFFGFQWTSIFIANDSKGSILTIFLRFIAFPDIRLFTFAALFLTVLVCILHEKILDILKRLDQRSRLILVLAIFSLFLKIHSLLFVIALAWPLSRLFFIKDNKDTAISIALLGLAYAGTLTAGYNAVSMEFLVGLFVAEFMVVIFGKPVIDYNLKIKILIPSLTMLLIVLPKIISPYGYDWWGLKSSGILNSNKVLTESHLRGMVTDENTASMIEAISHYKKHLSEDDRILSFPSIPLAYLLLDKKPYANPILWFDASTRADSTKTINEASKKLPKVIFWLQPPISVYLGHFKLRGADPGLIEVDKWVKDRIYDGSYKVAKAIVSYDNDSLYVSNYAQTSLDLNKDLNSVKIKDLAPKCILMNCEVVDKGSYITITFQNGLDYKNFINSSTYIIRSTDHIFYVLEKREL